MGSQILEARRLRGGCIRRGGPSPRRRGSDRRAHCPRCGLPDGRRCRHSRSHPACPHRCELRSSPSRLAATPSPPLPDGAGSPRRWRPRRVRTGRRRRNHRPRSSRCGRDALAAASCTIVLWRSRTGRKASPSSWIILVEPSMSEKRKLTVPRGRSPEFMANTKLTTARPLPAAVFGLVQGCIKMPGALVEAGPLARRQDRGRDRGASPWRDRALRSRSGRGRCARHRYAGVPDPAPHAKRP